MRKLGAHTCRSRNFSYGLGAMVKEEVVHAVSAVDWIKQCCSHVTHTSLARKKTGDAEIGWRPTRFPAGAKNSPEIGLVDLGRVTRTSTQSRRLVRREGASWSLNWSSGANLLAHMQLKCILNVPLWLLCNCLSLF